MHCTMHARNDGTSRVYFVGICQQPVSNKKQNVLHDNSLTPIVRNNFSDKFVKHIIIFYELYLINYFRTYRYIKFHFHNYYIIIHFILQLHNYYTFYFYVRIRVKNTSSLAAFCRQANICRYTSLRLIKFSFD